MGIRGAGGGIRRRSPITVRRSSRSRSSICWTRRNARRRLSGGTLDRQRSLYFSYGTFDWLRRCVRRRSCCRWGFRRLRSWRCRGQRRWRFYNRNCRQGAGRGLRGGRLNRHGCWRRRRCGRWRRRRCGLLRWCFARLRRWPLRWRRHWTLDDAWPRLRNQTFGRLLVERFESEIVSFAENVYESFDSGQQPLAVASAFNFRAHAPAHVANQAVGEVGLNTAAEVRKELSVVSGNHEYESFAWALRPNVPLVGDAQRIVVEIFGAHALDGRDEKLNAGSLFQISENGFESLFGRGIDHFGKVINVSARLWQLGALRSTVQSRTRPNK